MTKDSNLVDSVGMAVGMSIANTALVPSTMSEAVAKFDELVADGKGYPADGLDRSFDTAVEMSIDAGWEHVIRRAKKGEVEILVRGNRVKLIGYSMGAWCVSYST